MVGLQTHEKMSSIISHQENEMKATIRYHYTPTTTAKMEKIDNAKCWSECGGNRNSPALLMGMQNGATT